MAGVSCCLFASYQLFSSFSVIIYALSKEKETRGIEALTVGKVSFDPPSIQSLFVGSFASRSTNGEFGSDGSEGVLSFIDIEPYPGLKEVNLTGRLFFIAMMAAYMLDVWPWWRSHTDEASESDGWMVGGGRGV